MSFWKNLKDRKPIMSIFSRDRTNYEEKNREIFKVGFMVGKILKIDFNVLKISEVDFEDNEIFKVNFKRLKTGQIYEEQDFGLTHPWWGPPRQAPAAVSPPPPLTRLQPPCPLFDPIFFGKEVANSKLKSLSKTRTLHLLTRLRAPVIGGRTILPMPLHQYGCGRGIATNSSPPNEGPPVSLDHQTKVNKSLMRKNFFSKQIGMIAS